MNKIILLFVVLACGLVLAAPRSARTKSASARTLLDKGAVVTTNSTGQITQVVTHGTNTIVMIENGFKVPIRYRLKWNTFSDEQKVAIQMQEAMNSEVPLMVPKKPEEPKSTDDRISEEVRVIQAR